jgi:hypothetical protein
MINYRTRWDLTTPTRLRLHSVYTLHGRIIGGQQLCFIQAQNLDFLIDFAYISEAAEGVRPSFHDF